MITTAAQNQQASTFFTDAISRINKNNCKGDFTDIAAAASTTLTKSKESHTSLSAAFKDSFSRAAQASDTFTAPQSPSISRTSTKPFEAALQAANTITTGTSTKKQNGIDGTTIEIDETVNFRYSRHVPGLSPEELDPYCYPSCLGAHLLGGFYDKEFLRKREASLSDYERLWEKSVPIRKDVKEKYELNGLSSEEFFQKTHGPMSKEMTDYFYNSFDAEGRQLIAHFFPHIAQHYGWDTAA